MKKTDEQYSYISLFIISASFLVLEFLVSRIMSVVAWYHFAFFAVSLALFGITVGAIVVHFNKSEYLDRTNYYLSFYAYLFGLSLLNLILVISQLSFIYNIPGQGIVYNYPIMILILLSIGLPFIFSGAFICLCLTKLASQAHKAYFIDLLGSSLGCLVFIPLINFLNAFNSMLFISLISFLTSFMIHRSARPLPALKKKSIVLGILVFILILSNLALNFLDFRWTKGQVDSQALYKKWNAFSYIRLTDMGQSSPYGWGMAPLKYGEIYNKGIKQLYLEIDGAAGTMMTEFRGDLSFINYLKYDITAFAHYLIKNGDILIIGVGAGRDILTGLVFKQKNITGVEINQSILETLNKVFGPLTGNLHKYPNIQFVNDEARSYIASAKKKYDLIQISLIDTLAASLSGAYALTENSLYTREAFKIYLENLTPNGVLSISYWMNPDYTRHILRLTGVASTALEHLGVKETHKNIAIVFKAKIWEDGGVATLLVKKDPFTQQEVTQIQKVCSEMGFDFLLDPLNPTQSSFAMMADTATRDSFIQKTELNIAPLTDDSPFFFLFQKVNLKNFLSSLNTFNFDAEKILYSILALMIVLTSVFIFLPFFFQSVFRSQPIMNHPGAIPLSLYFSSIGLAFMFVEISQMTRLNIFLGHPVYSLTVVLFTLLASSGLGSYVLGREHTPRKMTIIYIIYILMAFLFYIFLPSVLVLLTKNNLLTRIIVSVIFMAPLGFFMGSFMPHGIRLVEQRKGSVAFFWGLNGAMSVVGSVLTMIFMIAIGINQTFLIGIILYCFAILLLLNLSACKY